MTPAPGFEVDWNLVRTFTSVVEAGSLAGAARSLDLAHPTVARHVQQLESQLGVQLFERCANGLSLNDAGRQLAEVAQRMRREAMTLEALGETVRSTTTGRVKVTIAEVLAELVAELLLPLMDLPDAEARYIELIVTGERLNLLEREADIAIRHVRPTQQELVCRRVGQLPLGAWASAAYLERHGEPTMDTLAQHCFVDGLTSQPFTTAVERQGYRIPQRRVSFRTDSLQCQRRAGELGWGIVGLPDYLGERSAVLEPVLRDTAHGASLDIWLVGRPAVRQQRLLKHTFDSLGNGLAARFDDLPAQYAPRAAGGGASKGVSSLSA